jgi:butyrate kinase
MTTLVKKSLKEEQFHPANVLKEMDRKGGVLSYEGVEVLRMVEGAQKHSHNTIIPSKIITPALCSNGGSLR